MSWQIVLSAIVAVAAALFIALSQLKHPTADEFLSLQAIATTNIPVRLVRDNILGQILKKSPKCTTATDLSGQLILLTGGNSGIGYETARELARRGADIIITSRNAKRGEHSVQQIRDDVKAGGDVFFMQVDLSDLASVLQLSRKVSNTFPGRRINQLIQNAGVWPNEYSLSPQGHEVSFATNLLGPHLLLRVLVASNLLAEQNARVIILTGDIYVIADDCTKDFDYSENKNGGPGKMPYSRSKLGVMWLFPEYVARFPNLHFNLVHPGVINNNLNGGPQNFFEAHLARTLLIDNKHGAQTTLICATAPLDQLVNGAYYHNAMGRVTLQASDPASNPKRGREMWELVESLIVDYMIE